MNEQKYDIVDVVDDICKEAYNFGVFTLNYFYKTSNLEALKQSFDTYAISRFSQTIEAFQYEHNKIDDEKKREFYQNLKDNEQNLAYLYSMFEEARSSAFLIHMKILAWLSHYLIENKGLDYHQSSFLANIRSLNELDFKYFYELLNGQEIDSIITDDPIKVTVIKKFIQIGILSFDETLHIGAGDEQTVHFKKNAFSRELLNELKLIFNK